MANELRYIATVNGVNVGTFASIDTALTEATKAVGAGMGGPHIMNGPRRMIEVRDTKVGYQLVSSKQM